MSKLVHGLVKLILTGFLLAASFGFQTEAQLARPAFDNIDPTALWFVEVFCFDGTGRGGGLSYGQTVFESVMTGTNALEHFKRTMTKGTPEAKMYALVGIQHLAPQDFDRYADPIIRTNDMVRERTGCIQRLEKADVIIARIKNGDYDYYLTKPKSVPQSGLPLLDPKF